MLMVVNGVIGANMITLLDMMALTVLKEFCNSATNTNATQYAKHLIYRICASCCEPCLAILQTTVGALFDLSFNIKQVLICFPVSHGSGSEGGSIIPPPDSHLELAQNHSWVEIYKAAIQAHSMLRLA